MLRLLNGSILFLMVVVLVWLSGALWGLVHASPDVPSGQKWDLPESSGQRVLVGDIPPAPSSVRMDGEAIARAAWRCFPEPVGGWMRPEIKAVAGPRLSVDDATAGYWAGITASLPLYSHVELEKEREKSRNRKQDIAQLVGEYLKARAAVLRGRRAVALFDAIETRARSRTLAGVAPSSEQETAAEKAIEARSLLESSMADMEAARLGLIAPCDPEGLLALEEALH